MIHNDKQYTKTTKKIESKSKKIKIYVSYSGKCWIEDGDDNHATQLMYYRLIKENDSGVVYYCPRAKKMFYLRKAITYIQKECDKEIAALEKKKTAMGKLAEKQKAIMGKLAIELGL